MSGICLRTECFDSTLIDNSAARQIVMRAGVGRVRHLSVKILWLQQQVERKMVSVAAVASSANVADLGTKRLACHTMRRLMYEVGVYDGSGRVGVEELEEHQQKALIKRIMSMTSTTPSLSTRSSGNLQLALLTAMLPNALGSRVAMGGQSIFLMTSITIPLWFVVVIVLVALAVAWYLINEIRGLRKSLYSWRDLCNEMDSDDREVRRRAMRRYQKTRRMMTPSTYNTTEVERDGLLQDFAETATGGQRIQENEIPLRVEVLRNIGQHMQLNARENSIFMRAFSELNSRDRETMNECLVNMLYFMNSGDENQVRQSFMAMGIILQKIGARTMPLGSPESEEVETPFEKRIVTLIYKRKFSKVPFEKADAQFA